MQAIEQTSVRTSRTHNRRSYRHVILKCDILRLLAKYLFGNDSLWYLAHKAEKLLADNVHAVLFAVCFDNIVKLLDYIDLFALCGKVFYYLNWHWVYDTEFEIWSLVAQSFLCILIWDTACDNAYLCIVHLYLVERWSFGIISDSFHSCFNNRVTADSVTRHHNIFLDILFIWDILPFLSLAKFNGWLRVRNSGGQSYDNRNIELFRKLESSLSKLLALPWIGRLYHHCLRSDSMVTWILLVLWRVHTRVIGDSYYHTCRYACVACCVKRVSGNVKTNVLHSAEASCTTYRSAKSHFHCHLFIRRPLSIYLVIFCNSFCYLSWRSAGVRWYHLTACLIQTSCKRLVSKH